MKDVDLYITIPYVGPTVAKGRSKGDAPEIDGEVHLRDAGGLKPGDIVSVSVEDADEHDLYGVPL